MSELLENKNVPFEKNEEPSGCLTINSLKHKQLEQARFQVERWSSWTYNAVIPALCEAASLGQPYESVIVIREAPCLAFLHYNSKAHMIW